MSRTDHRLPADGPRGSGAGGPSLSDPPSPRLGSRRRAVLQSLRQSPEALGVADVAALAGLHPNTARFHLDALTEDGLAVRTVETRMSPGRPRVLYVARAEAMDQRSYGLLAEMLAGLAAASGDAHEAAVATGRSWGRKFVQRPSSEGVLDADRAVDALHQVFVDIGFQPEMSTEGETTSWMLRHCPFREVATRHPTVVCGVHLGLMQGVLDELGGAAVAQSLDPFVTPRLCVARVRKTSAP
jgi:predicted ArsR family transcriptional regulator